jgi:serine/threonine-protein kinase
MPILRPEERIGAVLAGKYRIERVIGRGGMGVVLAGVHEWTGRPVAVKILAPDLSGEPSIVKRFLQEAKAAARMKHPNVVDVLDMGADEDESVYLVLELLEGESLGALVERSTKLDPKRALELTLPIVDALARAHELGIVHRDIKPDNVFLSVDAHGRVVPKLLDFGIAKVRDAGGRGTTTGSILGTPYYMSPEQVRGAAELGPASDVWSMGVLLYEVLSGELPFWAETGTGVLASILTTEARKLAERAPDLPPAIAETVDRAMAREVAERFGDAGALARALVEAADRSGIALSGLDGLLERLRGGAAAPAVAASDGDATAARDSDASASEGDASEGDATAASEGNAIAASNDDAVAASDPPREDTPSWSRSSERASSSSHPPTRVPTPVTLPPAPAAPSEPIALPRTRGPLVVLALVAGLAIVGVVVVLALPGTPPSAPPEPTPRVAAPVASPPPAPVPPVAPPPPTPTPPAIEPTPAPPAEPEEPRRARPTKTRAASPTDEPSPSPETPAIQRGANDSLIID